MHGIQKFVVREYSLDGLAREEDLFGEGQLFEYQGGGAGKKVA
jgi:hypothetical protein